MDMENVVDEACIGGNSNVIFSGLLVDCGRREPPRAATGQIIDP
jgi:hypothetical protein